MNSCDRTSALGVDWNEGRGVRSSDILRWSYSQEVAYYQSKVKVTRQICVQVNEQWRYLGRDEKGVKRMIVYKRLVNPTYVCGV
jgi:hypothetical protein